MDMGGLTTLTAGLGQAQVSDDPTVVLVARGLGSCVGICAYDPVAKVGGLLHAMLPENNGRGDNLPTKYVDTGLDVLLDTMADLGAVHVRTVFRLAGGANMLKAPGFKGILDIGARNVESATNILKAKRLRLSDSDTGGHKGRTVKLYIATGEMEVRSVGGKVRKYTL